MFSGRLKDTGIQSRADIDALEVTSADHTSQLAQIVPNYGNRYVRALATRLVAKAEPACMTFVGDSTGNDGNEWIENITTWLKDFYPNHTFYKRLWNHDKQRYDPFRVSGGATRVQTGAAGDAYAVLPGGAGNSLSIAYQAFHAIAGDIDIRLKVAMDDWTPAATTNLVSRYGPTDPNRGWYFSIDTAGILHFTWFPDGSFASKIDVHPSAVIPGTVAGQAEWLRVTLDVDNDAGGYEVKFYKGNAGYDGDYWTQIGTTVTGASTTALVNSAVVATYIGASPNGSLANLAGKVYEAEVFNGIDGTVVMSPNLDRAFPAGITTFTDCEGNTVTVNGTVTVGNGSPGFTILNASASGQAIAYSTDSTRFTLQTPFEPQLFFISYGHNEGTTVDYQTTYEGLCTQVLTKYPNAGIVCVTQNPRVSPATNPVPHDQRNQRIALLSAKNNYGLIDAYRAFVEADDDATYISADGVHPTVAGGVLWATVAEAFLKPLEN